MIWFNGQRLESASLDATNAGALLGWGIFTTLAVRGGAPVLWARHLARLERDAAAAKLDLPYAPAQLRAGLDELVGALKIGDGLARISGTRRGDGRWNAAPGTDWSIVAQGAPAPPGAPDGAGAPLRVQLSPFRVAARAPLAGVKTTSYLPYLWAFEAARDAGYDEALLLTESGLVCESARASVFWFGGGKWHTPALDCGCLRGVGREVALEITGARPGRWKLESLLEADEAFVISAAGGVRAVGVLGDERTRRTWSGLGPQTRRVTAAWEVCLETD